MIVVVALPQIGAWCGSQVVDTSGGYGLERRDQTSQRFAFRRNGPRMIHANVGSIHELCRGCGSGLGGSRTAPTGFVRIHTVCDYDNAVYVVGHYYPFVHADVRVLFCQPDPTTGHLSAAGVRSHLVVYHRPKDMRPAMGADGYEIRPVPSVVVAFQPDRPATVSACMSHRGPSIGTRHPTH